MSVVQLQPSSPPTEAKFELHLIFRANLKGLRLLPLKPSCLFLGPGALKGKVIYTQLLPLFRRGAWLRGEDMPRLSFQILGNWQVPRV